MFVQRIKKWFVLTALIVLSISVLYLKSQTKRLPEDSNLKLETFLHENGKKGGIFQCKYSHVYDGPYKAIPNNHQYVRLQFKNGTLLISGSERSVMDAWDLPFKYTFDEKTKTIKSEGVVKYYLVNNRKIIIGDNPENHVGPIRSSIKNMAYQLQIKFEFYPVYVNHFNVDIKAKSDDGDLTVGISC